MLVVPHEEVFPTHVRDDLILARHFLDAGAQFCVAGDFAA